METLQRNVSRRFFSRTCYYYRFPLPLPHSAVTHAGHELGLKKMITSRWFYHTIIAFAADLYFSANKLSQNRVRLN